MSTSEHLRALRLAEVDRVAPTLPAGGAVLEIGAGSGWQARRLAQFGFDVSAIEIEGSRHLEISVFPTRTYDGRALPFAARSFDAVFSSNVLEHVPDLPGLQREIRRVLKPGGRAVHVLPTPSWRLWTSLAHYPHVGLLLSRRWRRVRSPAEGGPSRSDGARAGRRGRASALRSLLAPSRHGVNGTWLTEAWHFSRARWRREFRSAGFRIVATFPAGLFYTGYSVLDARLGLPARARLARVLGSSSRAWVLEADGSMITERI